MAQQNSDVIPLQKITKTGTTAKRKAISDRLLKLFYDLTQEQRHAFETAPNISTLNQMRLDAYDSYQKPIMNAVLELADSLEQKQAGGRPTHKHFNLGYRLLKNHYIETGEILKPQALSKKVWTELREAGLGPKNPGDELFPTRIASRVITLFKISLPFEDCFKN